MSHGSALDLARLAFATYLVALTIARMHGPFGLAEKLRHTVYVRRGFTRSPGSVEDDWLASGASPDDKRRTRLIEDDWLTAGISCPVCLAPYVAALLLLAPAPVLAWLAAAGGAAAIYKLSSR